MLAVAQPASKESAGKKPAPNPPAGAPLIEWEAPAPALQRKTCPCGGGCPKCLSPVGGTMLQTKLTVNTPGDAFELEADRVAEHVMRMAPVPRACPCGGGCPNCQSNRQPSEALQMKATASAAPVGTAAPPIVHQVLQSPGQPLDATARAFLEPRLRQAKPDNLEAPPATPETSRFAHDFSQMPVHATSPARVQAKLTLSTPGDIYEQEADRVSEQIVRMPEPQLQRACACGKTSTTYEARQLDDGDERLQPKLTQVSNTGGTAAPPIVHDVLRSPGEPLDRATRNFMEARFGYDFSGVRVHSGTAAWQSAREVNAEAYTVGHNVVFGAGKFAPGSNEGRRLLAHELAHVVQQSALGPARMERLRIAAPDSKPEREAERAAESASSSWPYPVYHRTPQGIVQRQMCRDILNAEEVPGVTRGKEVERLVRVDMMTQLGAQYVVPLAIPDASSRLKRMEECGGFQTTQPPGFGFPDLAFRNGRNVELAEVKIATWPCLTLAEEQVDRYVDMANENDALKRWLGVNEFELMPTSRFTPSQQRTPDGTPVDVGWCSPGVIVYKAVTRSYRDVLVCGYSDKGRTDDFLDRLLDPAIELAARAMRRRLEELGLGPVNFRLLLAEVRKRIRDHIRRYLQGIIDTLCATAKVITLAAVLADLRRLLSLKDVADGFLERFNHPGEGIDIPVGKLAGETAVGLAIIGALAELAELVFAF